MLAAALPAQGLAGVVPPPTAPGARIVHTIAEGFHTDRLPPGVRVVWPSVFAFVCEGPASIYIATAFLVRRTPRGGSADNYFITAGHAIEDCKLPRRYLVEDLQQQRFESDGITLAQPPQRLAGIEVVARDDAYDMALIKVATPAVVKIGTPIKVDGKCDAALRQEIYAIGFPGVGKRRSLRLGREVKRWSKGDYIGLGRAEQGGIMSTYIASTVDSLPGNSGGPVVDAAGGLVGVMVKGASNAENGFRYDVDPRTADDWQSFLVPCQAVLHMMERRGAK
ncbi:MAG: serine protease [Hyphomicrobium sp.]